MRSRVIAILIAVFWVAMVYSLVVQRILPARFRAEGRLLEPEVLALQWNDIDETMWVRRGGETLGAMTLFVTQDNRPTGAESLSATYLVTQKADMVVPVMFFRQRVQFSLVVQLSPEFNISRFAASIDASPVKLQCEGFVRDDRLFFRVLRDGADPVYRSVRLKRPLSLLDAVRPLITNQFDLRVGESYSVEIADPIWNLASGRADVRVAARETIVLDGAEVETYRIDSSFQEVTRRTWVSLEGKALRRDFLLGGVLEKALRSEVRQAYPDLFRPLDLPDFDESEFAAQAVEADELQAPPEGWLSGILNAGGGSAKP